MNWPRWHWLNDGLIPLLVITLRVCWLWPWIEVLRHWLAPAHPQPLVPLWALFGLFILSVVVTRSVQHRSLSLAQGRIWVAATGLAAVLGLLWWQTASATYPLWNVRWLRLLAYALSDWLVAVPPSFLTLVIATTIWVRGVKDGQRPLMRDAVWSAFTTGTLVLALLLWAGHFTPDALPLHTERWILAFFVVGLSALALSSLQLARAVGTWGAQKQAQMRLNRYWLLSVAVVILGMLAVGLIVGALVTPGAVAQALSWVGVVVGWLGTIVGYVFLAIAYVIFLVLTPLIEWIRGRMSEREPGEEPVNALDWQEQLEELRQQPPTQLSPEAVESLRWVWLALLLIGIVVLIAVALRLMKFAGSDSEDETRESIFSRDMLQAQWAALWGSWLQRLQRPAAAAPDPYLPLTGEVENRRAIRSIYQSLLSLAGARGLARTPPQTPLDYAAVLRVETAADADDWSVLTEEYMAARYAPQPPTEQQVERARQAWARVSPRLAADQEASDEKTQTDPPGAAGRRRQDPP